MTVNNLSELTAQCSTTDSSCYTLNSTVTELDLGGNITLDRELKIAHSVTINGNGHTVSGNNQCRVINITSGSVNIENLTITGGNSATGGGMYVGMAGAVTLTNCTFSENQSPSGEGGGVYVAGTMKAANCTFSNNTAGGTAGGGMWTKGTAAVINCTFTGNQASDYGGMYVANGSVTVINCTFANNKATDSNTIFPELYVSGGTLKAVNTIFWNTTTTNYIGKDGNWGTLNLYNCAYKSGAFSDGTATPDDGCKTISDWDDRTSEDVEVDGVKHTVFKLTAADTALIGKALPAADAVKKLTGLSDSDKTAITTALAEDQIGNKRNSAPDIGAFEYINVESVNLNKTSTTITVGETETLTAEVAPKNAVVKTVTWDSSDTSIATVNDGVVMGVKAGGPVTITAMAKDGSGKSATCQVTVTDDSAGGDTTPAPESTQQPETTVNTPTPESLIPDMTDEQKTEAAGTAADALEASGNPEAAAEFRNATPATADETKNAITQATQEEAQQSANNATEEMVSQGREVRGEPVAIGTVAFKETRLVFLAVTLPDSMKVGDLLTLFKNEQTSGNAASLAAENSGAAVFLDSAGKETKVVPEDRKVTLVTVFEGGKTYQPVVVATKPTEENGANPSPSSGNSGCDAGLGGVGFVSCAALPFLAWKKRR